MQKVWILPCQGAHAGADADALARTVFPLYVSQKLRDSPLQDNHLNSRDALSP